MNRRIVVTGWGLVSSLSCEVEDCWSRILAGESGVHAIRLIETEDLKVKIGGDVYDWDGSQYLDPKTCKKVDRFSQFAMVAANQAVASSGIDFTTGDNLRYGCLLGSGIGGLITISEQMERLIIKGPSRVSPLTIPKLMLNAGGGNIAIEHRLRGPNYSVATACASAGNAMGDALSLIGKGECEVLITGGAECALTRIGVSAFQNMRALSLRNDDPGAASRPFDRGRDGFVLSEGAGILIFEELEHAKARRAEILGEVIGFGTTCDAGHITSPDPSGTGAARAMSLALQDAGIAPEEVDYINAHGTSTPLGDVAETIAMKNVFGDHAHQVSISSTKSQIGHSLGASGGLELIFSLKALLNNIVPPTINLDDPDPDCDLDYTPNQPKEREIRTVMSNSFGFGGHNASIIIRQFSD
ncbi:MAG: beta-ketoacyl-ACP synthase II [Mariniblastus sp.]|nr:beta-ketoacyl-ACP synthase II [Mariniblastus sp.]